MTTLTVYKRAEGEYSLHRVTALISLENKTITLVLPKEMLRQVHVPKPLQTPDMSILSTTADCSQGEGDNGGSDYEDGFEAMPKKRGRKPIAANSAKAERKQPIKINLASSTGEPPKKRKRKVKVDESYS